MSERIALVTGASRGIGAATARELGRRGYHVIVNYLTSADPAKAVVTGIEAEGGSAESMRADVRDADQVTELTDRVAEQYERLDALVCNANTADPPFTPFDSLPWESFIRKVDDELAGVFFLTQRALGIMRPRGEGRIVYVSSISAEDVGGSVAHSAAKAALNAFTRHVAATAGQDGITVNAVAPGAVDTDATSDVITDPIRRHLSANSVVGRVLRPEDLATAIASVADDGFGTMSGQIIRVDGGLDVMRRLPKRG